MKNAETAPGISTATHERLRDSEEMFRLAFNQQFQFMALLSPEGVILEISDGPLQATGLPREACLGKPLWDIPAYNNMEEWREVIRRRIETARTMQEPLFCEGQYRASDGAIHTTDVVYTAIRGTDGLVQFILTQATDTTAKRAAEKALQDSQLRLERAERVAQLGNFTYDLGSQCIDGSEGLYRIFGREKEREPLAYAAFREWIHREDRALLDSHLERSRGLHPKERPPLREYRLQQPDGQVRNVELVLEAEFDSQGRPTQFFGTVRDVTDRREAEEAARESEISYRRVFESANDGIFLMQGEYFVDCNQKMTEILRRPREEMVGHKPWAISPRMQPNGLTSEEFGRQCLQRTSETGALTMEWVHTGSDQSEIYCEVSLNAIPGGALAIVRDITERKKADQELRQAFREISELKDRLQAENTYLQEEIASGSDFGEIVGSSAALQATLRKIEQVAPTDATVLITGESGTGKELVAREIHGRSARRDRPLIRVNCASVPQELYESEFFGHVKGAFTGAIRDRAGRFELADGGTIFLDEIGEIPLAMQSKLLRVLQEAQYERVGGETTRSTDVRVIAATNRNLEEEVRKGRFRTDLFYRLNVFPIDIAPLRERADDIPLLVQHFVDTVAERLRVSVPRVSQANIQQLLHYGWPGNVRELHNVIERAVITSRKGQLQFDLPEVPEGTALRTSQPAAHLDTLPFVSEEEMRRRERDNILAALTHTEWRVFGNEGAAELLGLKPTTLKSRMKKMGIDRPGGSA